jgi:uncharacterized protein (DUF1697 family)
MAIYISFLRGVNMTGHNKIRMTELAQMYHDLGYPDAETFIQSGNVIFTAPGSGIESDIERSIEKSILERFGYNVPVMVRSVADLGNILSVNPFLSEEKFDPSRTAVILLTDKVTDQQLLKVANVNYPPDKFEVIGKEIFIFCPNGFGRTKLYTNFFENRMGVTGTARNWNTVTILYNMASARKG